MLYRACLIFFLLSGYIISGYGQSLFRYDTDFLTADFYKGRRMELRKQMPDHSMAILFSSQEKNRSGDVDFPFHQHPQFYYLTGFTEPNSVLLIFKSSFEIEGSLTDEILFIPSKNIKKEAWLGKIASTQEAKDITGVQTVYYTTAFDSLITDTSSFEKILYLPMPSGLIDDKNENNDLFDLVELFKKKFSFPPSNGDSFLLRKMLSRMREVKQPEEITLMRKAISITVNGHVEMMRSLHPGMNEYQAEAVGEYVFKRSGAEDVGYPSICGGGENSCILHYETNRKTLLGGELLLLDMGAEYHGYSADVTRTLPVSGKFTPEQKIIYNLVLKASDSAMTCCKPGNEFRDPHRAAVKIISKGLLDLGIIKEESEFKTYFMHGTSHYLGLDVHDIGTYGNLTEGNVITVEPGIYIPYNSPCDPKWWNIGVRIEDDILVTAGGYENLSISCPSKMEEIEKVMKEAPAFVLPFK